MRKNWIVIIAVASVLVILAAAAVVMALRSDHSAVRYQGFIARSPDLVWEYITRPAYRSLWTRGLINVVPLRGDVAVPGSTNLLVLMREGQKFEVEEIIQEAERPHFLTSLTGGKSADIVTRITLEPSVGGTLVTLSQEVTFKTLTGQYLSAFVTRSSREDLEHSFKRLKKLVESAPEEG